VGALAQAVVDGRYEAPGGPVAALR
jgi:hypothetical protein